VLLRLADGAIELAVLGKLVGEPAEEPSRSSTGIGRQASITKASSSSVRRTT
jgi:hypothetical protein